MTSINLKINMAEIWDYHLEFIDWKTTSLQDKDNADRKLNPQLKIQMISKNAILDVVESERLE